MNLLSMEVLHKKRASVEGRKVDFVFVEDGDFNTIMQGDHREFIHEHQQGNVAIAVVGYPSFNMIVTDEISVSIDDVRALYPSDAHHL